MIIEYDILMKMGNKVTYHMDKANNTKYDTMILLVTIEHQNMNKNIKFWNVF